MKYTQKTKYFIYGVIATAVLVPLGTYAVKTIPVTFSEGDVLSASVLNSLMTRINDVQQGFTSVADLMAHGRVLFMTQVHLVLINVLLMECWSIPKRVI